MNILVTELFPCRGHKNMFVNYCKMLNHNGNKLTVIVPQNADIPNLDCDDVVRMPYVYYDRSFKDTVYNRTKHCLGVARFVDSICKQQRIDTVFVVTYDEKSYAIIQYLYLKNKNVFLLHNNNVDNSICSKYRNLAFNLFANNINHVVLAGFIKRGILKYFPKTNPNKVLVIPHPMNLVEPGDKISYDCVGISNGNDETIIKSIVEKEEREGFLSKLGLHVILKSQSINYDNGYLKVITGYLPDNEYDSYIREAASIFMPFPTNYKYRMSGTFVDALSNNKAIIAVSTKLIQEAQKTYKHSIYEYSIETFADSIKKIKDHGNDILQELSDFQSIHSIEHLTGILNEGIHRMINNEEIEDEYDF